MAGPLTAIDTPAVVLDQEKLEANIRRIQALADRHGVKLRPHAKTHKSIRIARMQLDAGAVGLTAAKPEEARVFLQAGVPSVTLAYPLIAPAKLSRLLAWAADAGSDLNLIVDSREGLTRLTETVTTSGIRPGVFIKIDVGLHRCGLSEEDPRILELARAAHQHSSLRFLGLLSHAGHAYGAGDAETVGKIAEAERRQMLRIRDRLVKKGIPVPEISIGATPTVLAAQRFDGVTEIRPGNYVFLDRTPVRQGLAEADAVALTVVASVVSRNSDYLVIDTGSKTLSSDQGAHGTPGGSGFGIGQPLDDFGGPDGWFQIERLSEEHGLIPRSQADLPLGARVRIIPNHACPVANLAGVYHVVGNRGAETWPVDAAGMVR